MPRYNDEDYTPPSARLAKLEEVAERLDKQINGNGQKGFIREIEELVKEMHRENTRRLDALEDAFSKWKWILCGVMIAVPFLSSSGTVSLKNVLESLGWIAKGTP